MKQLFARLQSLLEKVVSLFRFKVRRAQRALLRSEARERQANEAERLDRLRNPGNYRGR